MAGDTPPAAHEAFHIDSMSKPDAYKLLSSLVMPRPIAWVVTQSAEGVRNAAPFSFFNILSTDPPLVALGFSPASDRNGKDTLANIRSTGDMVIHMVSEAVADAMNTTAVDAPRGVDETALAGLQLAPSIDVAPPRIVASPAALECRLEREIDTGHGGTIVMARILQAHVRTDVFEDRARLHVDTDRLALIGRMTGGEGGYCRTSDTFTLARPKWQDR